MPPASHDIIFERSSLRDARSANYCSPPLFNAIFSIVVDSPANILRSLRLWGEAALFDDIQKMPIDAVSSYFWTIGYRVKM